MKTIPLTARLPDYRLDPPEDDQEPLEDTRDFDAIIEQEREDKAERSMKPFDR